MIKNKKFFNHDESPFFNAFIHFGMAVKVLAALGMILGLWYYF